MGLRKSMLGLTDHRKAIGHKEHKEHMDAMPEFPGLVGIEGFTGEER
jgi:hypothetical protein